MPSVAIHIATASVYAKKFKIDSFAEFRKGVIEPDILSMAGKEAKNEAHFSFPRTTNMTMRQRFQRKVDLLKFLKSKTIITDFDRGYYLHLLGDYYFFNHFILNTKFGNKIKFKDLYPDYEKMARDMEVIYGVDNSDTPWAGMYQEGEPEFYSRNEMYAFIEVCASTNLDEITKLVLKDEKHWRKNLEKLYFRLYNKAKKKMGIK